MLIATIVLVAVTGLLFSVHIVAAGNRAKIEALNVPHVAVEAHFSPVNFRSPWVGISHGYDRDDRRPSLRKVMSAKNGFVDLGNFWCLLRGEDGEERMLNGSGRPLDDFSGIWKLRRIVQSSRTEPPTTMPLDNFRRGFPRVSQNNRNTGPLYADGIWHFDRRRETYILPALVLRKQSVLHIDVPKAEPWSLVLPNRVLKKSLQFHSMIG
jgi:hypothetical protein